MTTPSYPRGLGAGGGFTLIEVLVVLAVLAVLVALVIPVTGSVHVSLNRASCASNQRQIGLALFTYANDHHGYLPPTTHTTGRRRIDESWIYELAPYLGHIDKVRICPAEPPDRQAALLRVKGTSYLLNDLVFDDPEFNQLSRLTDPANTLLLAILSENRAPSGTRDHIHGGEWTSFVRALNDIEPDRHRWGDRAPDRMSGSANYLYADGSVRNIAARDFADFFTRGINPARPPQPES
ncbi:MAG: DUF1559 domain-containing protein [Verrucomicrobiia bacterium]